MSNPIISFSDVHSVFPECICQEVSAEKQVVLKAKKQDRASYLLPITAVALGAIVMMGSLFLALAAHQVFPAGLNAISNLGIGGHVIGYVGLVGGGLILLIGAIKGVLSWKQNKEIEASIQANFKDIEHLALLNYLKSNQGLLKEDVVAIKGNPRSTTLIGGKESIILSDKNWNGSLASLGFEHATRFLTAKELKERITQHEKLRKDVRYILTQISKGTDEADLASLVTEEILNSPFWPRKCTLEDLIDQHHTEMKELISRSPEIRQEIEDILQWIEEGASIEEIASHVDEMILMSPFWPEGATLETLVAERNRLHSKEMKTHIYSIFEEIMNERADIKKVITYLDEVRDSPYWPELTLPDLFAILKALGSIPILSKSLDCFPKELNLSSDEWVAYLDSTPNRLVVISSDSPDLITIDFTGETPQQALVFFAVKHFESPKKLLTEGVVKERISSRRKAS